MVFNEVLRDRRKELGFTQEQIAEYLGVSTPAVNKWETGKSYPDIMLLSPLARLLETDLNTLLVFEEELTKEKEAQILNRAAGLIEKEGFEAGYTMLMENIRVYPNCHSFICRAALLMEGAFMLGVFEDRELHMTEIEDLYRRALESKDLEIRSYAATPLISKYIQREEYEKAQELLDSFPEMTFDKKQMHARLLAAQEKNEEAVRIWENQLLMDATAVYNRMITLMEFAIKEKNTEHAKYLADLCEKTARMFDLSQYSIQVPQFLLYAAQQDKENCLKQLEKIFSSIEDQWNPQDSPLYSHIQANQNGSVSIKKLFLNTLEQDESLAFLRNESAFQNILKLSKDSEKTIAKQDDRP